MPQTNEEEDEQGQNDSKQMEQDQTNQQRLEKNISSCNIYGEGYSVK